MQAGRAPATRKLKSHAVQRSEQVKGRGGKGIRTPDLLIANETLYQLSYTPNILISNELHNNIRSKNDILSIPVKRMESTAPASFSAASFTFRV